MPLYEYRCSTCATLFTAYKKLAAYKEPQPCSCGSVAEKVISAPMVAVDYPAYVSPATGKWVEGKKAHMEDLKASGCRLLEPGERQDMQKTQERKNSQLEKTKHRIIRRIYERINYFWGRKLNRNIIVLECKSLSTLGTNSWDSGLALCTVFRALFSVLKRDFG